MPMCFVATGCRPRILIVSARFPSRRAAAFALLALANLLWAGNWVAGRALRDAFDPVSLNFLRWLVAAAVLAPFALRSAIQQRAAIRRHAGLLALLAFTAVALFQTLVYLGLQTTTAVNAVLLNSSAPLFIVLCSWIFERQHATRRQLAGMLLSLAGIVVIMTHGEPGRLLTLELRAGDAWILLALAVWGIYSVLLKRRPAELGGVALLFVITVMGTAMLVPPLAIEGLRLPRTGAETAGVLYVGLAASVAAFICWNRGVAVVGANTAGFTLHLLPVFGTLLAIAFLGEAFALFHAAGIAIVVAGVVLATKT
jgi:drug/metabolite transporter (DMT)-like permease